MRHSKNISIDLNQRKEIIANISSDGDMSLKLSTFSLPNTDKSPPNNLEPITRPLDNLDGSSNIENLSRYTLSTDEINVLSKGLTFCPTPKFDQITLINDALTFARDIRNKFYQSLDPKPYSSDVPQCLRKFKGKPEVEPKPLPPNHPVEQFISMILSNLSSTTFENSLINKPVNMTQSERKAVRELKNNKSIIILPADKGSKIVIQDLTDYIAEANRQLSDTNSYKLLNEDPTADFSERIEHFILEHGLEEGLSKKTVNLLVPKNPRTPTFYTLPKIHKNIKPPPGRPIVASYGSPTERISGYIDDQLQPFVKQLPSYIKNTDDFLKNFVKLTNPWTKTQSLVLWMSLPYIQIYPIMMALNL